MARYEGYDPYIGISGVVGPEQQYAIEVITEEFSVSDLGRFVALGIQATIKTQVRNEENRSGTRYFPVGDDIRGAAVKSHDGTRNYVHIALAHDLPPDNTLNRFLIEQAHVRTESWIDGIQINAARMHGPGDNDALRRVCEFVRLKSPNQPIVLQIHPGMLVYPDFLPRMVEDYTDLIDYALVDTSMGNGTPYDVIKVQATLRALSDQRPRFGLGVAGGLSAENVDQLFGPLLEEFPDLSCDAQGRLRKMEGGYSVLDLEAVRGYISACADVIKNRATRIGHLTSER